MFEVQSFGSKYSDFYLLSSPPVRQLTDSVRAGNFGLLTSNFGLPTSVFLLLSLTHLNGLIFLEVF